MRLLVVAETVPCGIARYLMAPSEPTPSCLEGKECKLAFIDLMYTFSVLIALIFIKNVV